MRGKRIWKGLLLCLLVVGPMRAEAIDLDKAAERVQKKIDGRVLGGKSVTEDGRTVHVIRVLTPDGRVVHIRVDQETGRILNPSATER
ncbi:MAG: PepSY domain-containing protein [Methylothermaceae bacterium]|nr:PepSY domain-containing protein [Methylothermaceae bacterium]